MPMAIPLIAAYASISAGIAATGFIGGLMIAGGAMTAMGALTHDKTLSQWGGVLSLAGGVASLADGAWSASAESIAADSGVGLATDGAETALTPEQLNAGNPVDAAASAAVDGGAAVPAPTPGAPITPGGMLTTATPPPNGMLDPLDTSLPEAGGPPATVAPTQPTLNAPGGQPATSSVTAPAPAAPSAPAATATASPTQPAVAPDAVTAPGINKLPPSTVKAPPTYTGNYVKDFITWASDKPENARIAQAGSGLLTAGMNYYGQQDAVKTSIALQEAANQRARDRINSSTRGLAVPTYQPRKG